MKNPTVAVVIGLSFILIAGLGYGQTGEGEDGGSTGEPAPPIPRTMVDKATIQLDGVALAKGEIVIAVETSTGKSHEARIGVVAKMKDKEITQMLVRDLQYAMSKDLEFKVNGTNRIKIGRVKKDKTTTFTVRVVSWTVFDVGFLISHN